MNRLPKEQYEIFSYLAGMNDFVSFETIIENTGYPQTVVSAFAKIFSESDLVELNESRYREFSLKEQGRLIASDILPERRIARAIAVNGGKANIRELPELTGLTSRDIGVNLKWLSKKGWAEKQGSDLVAMEPLTDEPTADEQLLGFLSGFSTVTEMELKASPQLSAMDLETAISDLLPRDGFLDVRERTARSVRLSSRGRVFVESGISWSEEVSQLTPEMIVSGKWRDVIFRKYDVQADAELIEQGKFHPFMKIIDQTRKVFLEMGFDEVESPYAESGFWDFDALFQPQDHPAREMQDTFFLERPGTCSLPSAELVKNVAATHENGGSTGSLGWGYKWGEEKAVQAVLRTHTTASTIRALSRNPEPARKVFCVGRVFRRETIDYKHLPVFFQVDGIIIDKKANFASLLGTLEAFYRKMGFEKFQFRPAFFPYTEPSVEVYVWHEKRRDWMEMGGAGIFRPEVTEPLGCDCPVMAWGLGLERIAIFRYGLNDIREIYMPDIKWLREVPACL